MMNQYWTVSEIGYRFSFPDIFSDETGKIIKSELEMLYVDDIVNKLGDVYVIDHESAAGLDAYKRNILQLPEVYPYQISIKCKGDMGHNDFRYIVTYQRFDSDIIVNPKITGSLISITDDEQYLFNTAQYHIIQTITNCNKKVKLITDRKDILNFNLEEFSKLKRYAAEVEAVLDSYLKKQQVVVPDKLSIKLIANADGSYLVEPLLLEKENDSYHEISANNDFCTAFNRQRTISNMYRDRNNTRYVIKDDVQKALDKIKQYHHINKDTFERIRLQPKEIFSEKAFEFNISDYSSRIESIGEFKQKSLPYFNLSENKWLPEEGTVTDFEGINESTLKVTSENVTALYAKIHEAQNNNQNYISYEGERYQITPILVRQVNDVYMNTFMEVGDEQSDKSDITDSFDDNDKNSDENTKDRIKSLLIYDNIEKLEYRSEERSQSIQGSLTTSEYFKGLRESIHLYEHQRAGIRWIWEQWKNGYNGVLLADDMGLGKTMQAYTFIASLKTMAKNNSMNSVLVVAPVSLLKNWQDEFQKFVNPGLFDGIVALYGDEISHYRSGDFIDFSSLERNALVLTTYETLKNYQLSFGRINWSVMVLDEAQKIKNPMISTTSAVKAMKYDFAIALTGTPVENSWIDLWSIMDFIVPGKLESLKEFIISYVQPLKTNKGNLQQVKALGERLQNNLYPVFLRRLKKDYLPELPKKEVHKLLVSMPSLQSNAYERVISNARGKGTSKIAKGRALQVLAQLRDISLCPYLSCYSLSAFYNMGSDKIISLSGRLMKTFEILQEIQARNEKVLLFVTSRKLQQIIKYVIEQQFHIPVATPINGALVSERRQQIVDEFNISEGFHVLILSVEAGGVGFNITSANNVIHLSRSWNPAKEDQATDRVYRIGQKKNVNVYIPITYDARLGRGASFDEKLDELLEYKRNLSDSVLYPTGDNADDGLRIFKELMDINDNSEKKYVISDSHSNYWKLDDIKDIEGLYFEKVVEQLYMKMNIGVVKKTSDNNDHGADVIVIGNDDKNNILIQCKQTSSNRNMDARGVQEVNSALSWYGNRYKRKFHGVVITNAESFTQSANELANACGIHLIAGDELNQLLKKYPVEKWIN